MIEAGKIELDRASFDLDETLGDTMRAMAIRAWMDGDLRLATRLLQWATPAQPVAVPRSQANPTPLLPAQPLWQAA